MRSPDREVTPRVLAPEDPYAGDESLFDPGRVANAALAGVRLTPDAYEAAERAFHTVYLDVLAGRRPWGDPEIPRLAAALGIPEGLKHDTRPPREAEVEVPDEVLADVVEDFAPDMAVVVERVTGSDDPAPLGAHAALAFLEVAVDGCRPVDLWVDEEEDRPLARSAKVIDASPPCLYADGRPLLPLAPRWTPDSGPAGVYVARAYRVGGTWRFACRVDLPRRPDPEVLLRRLRLELLRVRRRERRASFEDMLRWRPEVVYRACAEGTRPASDGPPAPGRAPGGDGG